MGNQWSTIGKAYVDFYKGLRYGKGNYENATDVHSRSMARYKEVPDWYVGIYLSYMAPRPPQESENTASC